MYNSGAAVGEQIVETVAAIYSVPIKKNLLGLKGRWSGSVFVGVLTEHLCPSRFQSDPPVVWNPFLPHLDVQAVIAPKKDEYPLEAI